MTIIHWIGIDDHADKWTIAHLEGANSRPTREFELTPGEAGFRRLVAYLKSLSGEVHVVYEAGPCGFDLYRKLRKVGVSCQVAAPTLTPRKPGDRVKTNRRDAAKLAGYLRSNELTMVSVPTEDQESLRDLVRQRQTIQSDVQRVRKQIVQMLLRYGYRYRDGKAWTQRFWVWLKKIKLAGDHSQFVFADMLIEVEHRAEQLRRFEAELEVTSRKPEYAAYVDALRTLKGIDTLSAMVILSELGDLRRFPSAPQLMAAVGLVPGENSTGDKTTRLPITKTGNAHVRHIVVEAAWHYQRRATSGRRTQQRRVNQPREVVEIAERCDKRLNTKFFRMTSRRKKSTIAAVAVARELVGFIWAIGQKVHPYA